jgi:hypothetical protein
MSNPTTNPYFAQGISGEQNLIENLIIESLKIYGNEMFYIPRTLVSKDDVLGEDRLSEFKTAYPIEMYFENIDTFGGQGTFIQKFGLIVEQSATLVVARKRWRQFIGRYNETIIPSRPCEGDLIYYPLAGDLYEIKFVEHQNPFYQLGKLYTYKLQVDLFQYASERIDTGIADIDAFETLKTFSTNTTRNPSGGVTAITVTNQGSGYTSVPTVVITSATGTGATATAVRGSGTTANKIVSINITNRGTGYVTAPAISFTGGAGTGALATATIEIDIDTNGFGNNNTFKDNATSVLNFDEHNPFGEIK